MESYCKIFQQPKTWARLISEEECLKDKQFLLPFGQSFFFVCLFCFKMTQSVQNIEPVVDNQKCLSILQQSQEFMGKVRWDVASRLCCLLEIRQGQFHTFTSSTAAGKFYFCSVVWLLFICQKWISPGTSYKFPLSFLSCVWLPHKNSLKIKRLWIHAFVQIKNFKIQSFGKENYFHIN